ncbi:CAP Gly-rich domain-containing protein [Epithele typhae]|uniref:CAP Gly-rich domain-containing protein n=1 Tax=Epithele typhae TaxID=378194 RepID=UPI002008166E|nr:CAP Gly-rich domain-containing protein [Epithele typhae]KAH9940757.1 CAP Gly-rich domain-containing protein [Epithele typhae]
MARTVNVFVRSPDTRSERRYDLALTVGQLKNKLELVTGIPPQNQKISVYANEDVPEPIIVLSDDNRPLGFYGVRDWQLLKVDDLNPSVSFTGQLTDTSQVDKFELSPEEYEQRQDTVLAYKQRNKIGRFAEKPAEEDVEGEEVEIQIGARCEVESAEEDFRKRGTVKFVGSTEFAKGVWVGIEYDEPIGKNDGSVKGKKYFECKPNFGVFVKPDRVKAGDFPVEEINFDDEEM